MFMKLTGFFQVPMVRQVLVRLDPMKYYAVCNQIKDRKGVEKLDAGGRNTNYRKEEAGSVTMTSI